jgi:nucleotide-binding universal stress UspA family protein
MLDQLCERLRATGLRVFATATVGQPQEIFLRKARELTVDCVFMHATGDPAVGGDLSPVAQALVLGAPCSVEVVRSKARYRHNFKPLRDEY